MESSALRLFVCCMRCNRCIRSTLRAFNHSSVHSWCLALAVLARKVPFVTSFIRWRSLRHRWVASDTLIIKVVVRPFAIANIGALFVEQGHSRVLDGDTSAVSLAAWPTTACWCFLLWWSNTKRTSRAVRFDVPGSAVKVWHRSTRPHQ